MTLILILTDLLREVIHCLSVFHRTSSCPNLTNLHMFITLEVRVILVILFPRLVLYLLPLLFMLTSAILTTYHFWRHLQWTMVHRKPTVCEENRSGLKKSNWSNANIPHYIFTLTALLSTIRVPYHLLQHQVPMNGKADIDCYYNQLVMCMKKAEESAVPRQHIRKKKTISLS